MRRGTVCSLALHNFAILRNDIWKVENEPRSFLAICSALQDVIELQKFSQDELLTDERNGELMREEETRVVVVNRRGTLCPFLYVIKRFVVAKKQL